MRTRSRLRTGAGLTSILAASGAAAWLVLACGGRGAAPRIHTPDPTTLRATPNGDVVGGPGRYGAHAWLGIPYARPPVGALRWRAPIPAERWTGVLPALAFGRPCPQYASVFGGVEGPPGSTAGDEDCLTLNVFAPPFAPEKVPSGDARLPVMVWIHGGGNTIGTASAYDGGNLAVSQGVIVVSVQYRLGPFGWLRHASLRADAANDAERSGNFAILDLVRALAWIRDDIAAFGGDPHNVTIFGESAGGTNVFMLLASPLARGLFQRAIVESGGTWRTTPAEAENTIDAPEPGDPKSSTEILLRMLRHDGAPDRAAARSMLAKMGDTEIAAYLRGKKTSEILDAYTPEPSGMIQMPRVFADGSVLPAGDFEERFATADGWNRVPVMLGTNRDEGRLFLFPDPKRVRKLFWIVPRFVNERTYLATADAQARLWKATGADGPAAAMRHVEPKVFVYRFDWDEEPTLLGADLSKMLGASHGFEIPFVFGHFDFGRASRRVFTEGNRPGREALARSMMSYWAAFARTGDPGRGTHGTEPAWTAWDPSSPSAPKYVVLDTPAGGGIRMESAIETPQAVVAGVEHDPRLETPEERCGVLRVLATGSRGYTRDQYAANAECAPFPFDSVATR